MSRRLDSNADCSTPTARAGLNERETPGKVVTAIPPKRLAQLRKSISDSRSVENI